jgi:hypothetical protein
MLKKTRNRKRFAELDKDERTVVDDHGTIGTVIIKPNGVGWKPKNGKRFDFVGWEAFEKMLAKEKSTTKITQ